MVFHALLQNVRSDVKTFLTPAQAQITPQSFDIAVCFLSSDINRTAPERYVRSRGLLLLIDSEEKLGAYAESLNKAGMRPLGFCRIGSEDNSPASGAWLADNTKTAEPVDFRSFWRSHTGTVMWNAEKRAYISREEIRLAVQDGFEKDVYKPQSHLYASIMPHMPPRSYQLLRGSKGEQILCFLGRNKKIAVVQCDESVKRNFLDAIELRDLLLQRLHKPDNPQITEKLNLAYEKYVEQYGGVHSDDFQTLFRSDCSWPTMLLLENFDEKGFVEGKGKVLSSAEFSSSPIRELHTYIYSPVKPNAQGQAKTNDLQLPDSAPGLFMAANAGLSQDSEAREVLKKLFVRDKETKIWDLRKDVVNTNTELLSGISFKEELEPLRAGRPRSPIPESCYDMMLCALNEYYPQFLSRILKDNSISTKSNEKAEKEMAAKIGKIIANFRSWTTVNVPVKEDFPGPRPQMFLDVSPGWFTDSVNLKDSVLNAACEGLYGSGMFSASLDPNDMMLAVVAASIESLQKTHSPSFLITEDEDAPMWNDFIRQTAPNVPIKTLVPAYLEKKTDMITWNRFDGIVIVPRSSYKKLNVGYKESHINKDLLLKYIDKRLDDLKNRINTQTFMPLATRLLHVKSTLNEIFRGEIPANAESFPAKSLVVFTSPEWLNEVAQHITFDALFSVEPEGVAARDIYCKLNMYERLRRKQSVGTTKICFVASDGLQNPTETANTYEEYLKAMQGGLTEYVFAPCKEIVPQNAPPITMQAVEGISETPGKDPLHQGAEQTEVKSSANRLQSMTKHFDPTVLLGYARQSEMYSESDQLKEPIETGCKFISRAVSSVVQMKDQAFLPFCPSGQQTYEAYSTHLEEVRTLFSILTSMGECYEGSTKINLTELLPALIVRYFSLTVFVELADLKLLVPEKNILDWWTDEKRKKYIEDFSSMYNAFSDFEKNQYTFAKLFQLSALMKKTMKEEIVSKKDKKNEEDIPIIRRLMSGWTHIQLMQNLIESILYSSEKTRNLSDPRRAGKTLLPDAILKKHKPLYAKLTKPVPQIVPENYSPDLYFEMISLTRYDYLIPGAVIEKLKGDERKEAELMNAALMDQIDLLIMLLADQNFYLAYGRGMDLVQELVSNLRTAKMKDADIKKSFVSKLKDLKNPEMQKAPNDRIKKIMRS